MNVKKAVLFRASDLPEDFISDLANHFEIYCLPVLSFSYTEFQENLCNLNFETIEAVVFPSQRSVIALARLNLQLPNLKYFAVGDSTSKLCEELLKISPDLTGTQGAKQLSLEIITNFNLKKILYLCGDNQTTLPYDEFRNAGIEILEVCCYKTCDISIEEFEENLKNVPFPDFCVFFSPSGVRCATNFLLWNWNSIKLIAIGNTTANELINLIGKCDGVPSQFNLNGIKQLLLDFVSDGSSL